MPAVAIAVALLSVVLVMLFGSPSPHATKPAVALCARRHPWISGFRRSAGLRGGEGERRAAIPERSEQETPAKVRAGGAELPGRQLGSDQDGLHRGREPQHQPVGGGA